MPTILLFSVQTCGTSLEPGWEASFHLNIYRSEVLMRVRAKYGSAKADESLM